jgi:hypothetical protein
VGLVSGLTSITILETTRGGVMANCLRWIRVCTLLLTGATGGLISAGCGGGEPPPSPTSEQYKEAKRRGDEARAKEYGRRSIHDPKAAGNPPARKGQR